MNIGTVTIKSMTETFQQKIDEALAAEPIVTITTNKENPSIPENEVRIKVELPNGCYAMGTVNDYGNGNIWFYGDMVNVPDEMQYKGIGMKLMRKITLEAKKLGATQMYGDVRSIGGLKLIANLFGKDALTFHNIISKDVIEDVDYEKALQANGRCGISVHLN